MGRAARRQLAIVVAGRARRGTFNKGALT